MCMGIILDNRALFIITHIFQDVKTEIFYFLRLFFFPGKYSGLYSLSAFPLRGMARWQRIIKNIIQPSAYRQYQRLAKLVGYML